MKDILRVFVKSQNVTIMSTDLNWGGNNCRQPMGTGNANKSGKAGGMLPEDHLIVLDAVTHAVNETGISHEIIDMRDWGFLKRLRNNTYSKTPRIEFNGGVLEGIPTTSEMVEFISVHL